MVVGRSKEYEIGSAKLPQDINLAPTEQIFDIEGSFMRLLTLFFVAWHV